MVRIIIYTLLILFNGFMLSSYAAVNDDGVKIKWSYKGNTGPTRWGQLNPAFILCAKGKRQSPININNNLKIISAKHSLQVNYQPAPMQLVDDGLTDLTIQQTKMIINDGHGIQVNFPVNNLKESIFFQNEEYRLVQFHFHSPSENELNGENFPMEIHFVHQGQNGKVLVIGVLVQTGAAHPVLQKLIKHFPKEQGVAQEIKDDTINPHDLLPENLSYYYFMGSLTTPPCTEGLQWLVLPSPIYASSGQIVLFRKAANGNNARFLQARNQRKLYYAKDMI